MRAPWFVAALAAAALLLPTAAADCPFHQHHCVNMAQANNAQSGTMTFDSILVEWIVYAEGDNPATPGVTEIHAGQKGYVVFKMTSTDPSAVGNLKFKAFSAPFITWTGSELLPEDGTYGAYDERAVTADFSVKDQFWTSLAFIPSLPGGNITGATGFVVTGSDGGAMVSEQGTLSLDIQPPLRDITEGAPLPLAFTLIGLVAAIVARRR